MNKKLDLPLILLAVAAFLTPLIGGQITTDAISMMPGTNSFLIALMGQSETPTLSHAILAALTSSALIIMILQRKILQVPNNIVSSFLLTLFGLITASIGYSHFRAASIPAALEWITYGVTFYAVVAIAGRQRGPIVLMGSLFAGCVVLALLGFQEYGNMKSIDPTWRIFPQWVGPNAMAAILLVGFFLGLGLATLTERLVSLAISFGCIAIGLALFLTQSKGAIIALIASLILYLVLMIVWVPKDKRKRPIGAMLAVFAVVVLLVGGTSIKPVEVKSSTQGSPSSSATGSPLNRFVNSSSSADQSVGFRRLLWKSSIKLIEENPVGTGIGAFQYYSAKPGLVTQTRLAHQTYLQLAAEASPLALMLLVAAILYWSFLVAKGGSKLAAPQNMLRASVTCAVCGILVHSFVDSDLSYYGIGMAFFMLLGIGLLLSTDAVAPEFMPSLLRRATAAGIAVFIVLFTFLGITESWRAEVRGFLAAKQYNDAQNLLESLRSMVPWDADAWNLSAQSTRSPNDRLAYAHRAAEVAPNTHNFRMLARMEADAGLLTDAKNDLQKVINLDPNNLLALTLLAEIQVKSGFGDEAKKTLQHLVDVEKSEYFKVRSLPELVPTETYHARVLLAQLETDPKAKADLLAPAVDGYREYYRHTIPNVIRFAKAPEGAMDFGGESVEKARAKMSEAEAAAKELSTAYRTIGNVAGAEDAGNDALDFAKALDSSSFK